MKLTPEEVNRLFPVTALQFFGQGVVKVKRESVLDSGSGPGGGPRRAIKYLSARARSYLAFCVAATEIEFHSMMTLTYGTPYPTDGAVCKAHLNALLTRMRNTHPGFSYVWVLEFQKRGALHYHVLTTIDSPGAWMRKDVAYKWARITAPSTWASDVSEEVDSNYRKQVYKVHKHKEAWSAIREENGATRYITKYALKMDQKEVPEEFDNVGRFFGMSRKVTKNARKPVTMLIDNEGLQILLEVEKHKTSEWGVSPRFLFGVELSPGPDFED